MRKKTKITVEVLKKIHLEWVVKKIAKPKKTKRNVRICPQCKRIKTASTICAICKIGKAPWSDEDLK